MDAALNLIYIISACVGGRVKWMNIICLSQGLDKLRASEPASHASHHVSHAYNLGPLRVARHMYWSYHDSMNSKGLRSKNVL